MAAETIEEHMETAQGTVVIADLSIMSSKHLAEVFRSEGLRVLSICHDGLSLVDAVVSHRPSVVALDLILPQLTGLQAVEVLRRKGLQSCFIVATAVSSRERVMAAKEAGVSSYHLKPIDEPRLRKAVSRIVSASDRLPNAPGG